VEQEVEDRLNLRRSFHTELIPASVPWYLWVLLVNRLDHLRPFMTGEEWSEWKHNKRKSIRWTFSRNSFKCPLQKQITRFFPPDWYLFTFGKKCIFVRSLNIFDLDFFIRSRILGLKSLPVSCLYNTNGTLHIKGRSYIELPTAFYQNRQSLFRKLFKYAQTSPNKLPSIVPFITEDPKKTHVCPSPASYREFHLNPARLEKYFEFSYF